MNIETIDFLKAYTEGKTVQYAYAEAAHDKYAWNDIGDHCVSADGRKLYNYTAMQYLMFGEQTPGYEIVLRIKPEETE